MKNEEQELSGKLTISQQLQWETRRRVDGLIKTELVLATILFLTSVVLHFYVPSFAKNGRAITIMPYIESASGNLLTMQCLTQAVNTDAT